ncbi:MAG: NUDIX hydrolase [Bacteroidota bacterium]
MDNLRTLASKRMYTGHVVSLVIDEIQYPSGATGIREVIEHPGGAVAVPLLDDNTLLLVRQFRYPTKETVLELPAGKLDPGEDPETCARRELEEETGYVAGRVEKLTAIYTTPGFCNERLHLFLARDLRKNDRGPLHTEGEVGMTLEPLDFGRAMEMIRNGDIVDAKTICGIMLTYFRLHSSS